MNGNTLQLSNRPSDGDYVLGLKVRAIDPAGKSWRRPQTGDVVVIGGGDGARFAQCIRELVSDLNKYRWYYKTPKPTPANYPLPETLVNLTHPVS